MLKLVSNIVSRRFPQEKMLLIGTSTISDTVCFGKKENNKQQTNLNIDLDQKMHPKQY